MKLLVHVPSICQSIHWSLPLTYSVHVLSIHTSHYHTYWSLIQVMTETFTFNLFHLGVFFWFFQRSITEKSENDQVNLHFQYKSCKKNFFPQSLLHFAIFILCLMNSIWECILVKSLIVNKDLSCWQVSTR